MIKKNLLLIGLIVPSLLMPQVAKATDNYIKYAGIATGLLVTGSVIYKMYRNYQDSKLVSSLYRKFYDSNQPYNQQDMQGKVIRKFAVEADKNAIVHQSKKHLDAIRKTISNNFTTATGNIYSDVELLANTNAVIRAAEASEDGKDYLCSIRAINEVRNSRPYFERETITSTRQLSYQVRRADQFLNTISDNYYNPDVNDLYQEIDDEDEDLVYQENVVD